RHVFVPRFYPDLYDTPQAIDGADPNRQQEWLDGVYSDSLIARMLTLLDVDKGHRVLEIGTGTGYNAALLCQRLGSAITHIDYDDVRTTTTSLNPAVLNDPDFRFLLQLTASSVGQIWTSVRDGRTLIRISGGDGAWAELDPTTGAVTQGGRTDLFDGIEHAAKHWDQHGHPDPARLGITAGPTGQIIWLDSPQQAHFLSVGCTSTRYGPPREPDQARQQ
ncbi:MAG: hypothetical protein ACRDQV_13455, partial [Pseudonocardiaceae bacterium]